MSLEDELRQLVHATKVRRETREREDAALYAQWNRKKGIIVAAVDAAVTALVDLIPEARREKENGGVYLRVDRQRFLHFSWLKEGRRVGCSSRLGEIPEHETFTLDQLDQDVVEAKVRAFVEAILAD